MPAQPLSFNLSLDDCGYDDEIATQRLEDNDSRLMEMLASQAAHREDESAIGDEDSVPTDNGIPEAQKKDILQKLLHMAASNGDMERVKKLLHGAAKAYIDVNAKDEEGTAPIIYASCFVSRSKHAKPCPVLKSDDRCRDIKTLCWHCLKLVQRSIGRIRTNGLL